MNGIFSRGEPAGERLTAWWAGLEDHRGARAELRRCRDEVEVALHPDVVRFCYRLRPEMTRQHGWEGRVAMILGLASHLNHNAAAEVLGSDRTLAERMAQRLGDRPTVSELRFRRLLRLERSQLYAPTMRVLHLLDGRVGLHDLANAVYYWGKEVRKEWADTYFPLVPEKGRTH